MIRRTKETPNVHPMYRDPRRKMGPLIYHKSNSQDRLIEELQGKLGIARKERPRKQPDDWLTEGVIVMNNPKRSREDHSGPDVDKVEEEGRGRENAGEGEERERTKSNEERKEKSFCFSFHFHVSVFIFST